MHTFCNPVFPRRLAHTDGLCDFLKKRISNNQHSISNGQMKKSDERIALLFNSAGTTEMNNER